ncbi:hypothetical protein [Alicyclobacillus suci]|uniref:hypothetical protein n=1 Tax=Alicyclobacillus suci TaxID=2816080 RepID=UPI001A9074B3|nr:hypothetical protein [Alicyclobacillus suci]
MNNEDDVKWTVCAISDADEPGDAAYTGMRHRDFDGVTLVLWPDDDGWLLTEALGQPARPLLLFFRGGDTEVEDALAWLKRGGLDGPCGPAMPFPTTFETNEGGSEAIQSVEAHLNYPPYPWLEEAKLGMKMGHYFDRVELADWTDPTETHTGSYTFRFYRSDAGSGEGVPHMEIKDDGLPY